MLTFFFSGRTGTKEVTNINSLPNDVNRLNAGHYLYCIEKKRVQFYGKYLTAFFCELNKVWISFEIDICDDSGTKNPSFMELDKIVIQ